MSPTLEYEWKPYEYEQHGSLMIIRDIHIMSTLHFTHVQFMHVFCRQSCRMMKLPWVSLSTKIGYWTEYMGASQGGHSFEFTGENYRWAKVGIHLNFWVSLWSIWNSGTTYLPDDKSQFDVHCTLEDDKVKHLDYTFVIEYIWWHDLCYCINYINYVYYVD
jgi:hypothetical protein